MNAVWLVTEEKQLPKFFLDEITINVVHVINRCYSIEDKKFFEKCNNQLPDIFNLRVFSCRA